MDAVVRRLGRRRATAPPRPARVASARFETVAGLLDEARRADAAGHRRQRCGNGWPAATAPTGTRWRRWPSHIPGLAPPLAGVRRSPAPRFCTPCGGGGDHPGRRAAAADRGRHGRPPRTGGHRCRRRYHGDGARLGCGADRRRSRRGRGRLPGRYFRRAAPSSRQGTWTTSKPSIPGITPHVRRFAIVPRPAIRTAPTTSTPRPSCASGRLAIGARFQRPRLSAGHHPKSPSRRVAASSATHRSGLPRARYAPAVDDEPSHTAQLAGVRRGLAAVAPGDRRALLLHAVRGLSYHEVASHLGITLGAVKSRIFRARATLSGRAATPSARSGDLP